MVLRLVLSASCLLLGVAAQDKEDSIFDADVGNACPAVTAPGRVSVTLDAAHSVTVSYPGISAASVVYLVDTYETILSCYSSAQNTCVKVNPNSCTGNSCSINYKDCWHKDVAENYHLASEGIKDLKAFVVLPGVCASSNMTETWYHQIMDYEAEVLDKEYGDWTVPAGTPAVLASMEPVLTRTTFTATTRQARVSMLRTAGYDVDFVYVKDSDGRVMWMKNFVGDGEPCTAGTCSYTSDTFDIPMVSTDMIACYPAPEYKTNCYTMDLKAPIMDAMPNPVTAWTSTGTYQIAALGTTDSYTVTPQAADYTACPNTYVLYAEVGLGLGEAGGEMKGLSVGSPLTIFIDFPENMLTFKMGCPGAAAMMTAGIDLAAEATAAALKPTDPAPVSGDTDSVTATTCEIAGAGPISISKAMGEVWDCDDCGSGKCTCVDGSVTCYGSPPSGESISSEEAVGIAIAVIITVCVIAFAGYFCYKKKSMMSVKVPTEADAINVEIPKGSETPVGAA